MGCLLLSCLYYYFKSSFYTLNTSPFLVKHNQVSVLIMTIYLLFFFITCDFSIIPKILPKQRSQKFNFIFSSKSLILLAYSFRYKTYFELIFCVVWKIYSVSFLLMWVSSWHSTISLKDHSFPIELFLAPFLKITDHKCEGLVFNFQFCSVYLYIFIPIRYCLK